MNKTKIKSRGSYKYTDVMPNSMLRLDTGKTFPNMSTESPMSKSYL